MDIAGVIACIMAGCAVIKIVMNYTEGHNLNAWEIGKPLILMMVVCNFNVLVLGPVDGVVNIISREMVKLMNVKPNKYVDRWETGKETYIATEQALDSLPEDASLCVSSSLLAHVADRDFVYEINYHGDAPDVDYVVVKSSEKGKARWNAYVAQGYEVVEEYSGTPIAVLKRGADKK